MRRSRVLLIEDNDDLRIMLGVHLEDRGLVMDTAATGAEALAAVAAALPDAVILDLGLPDMDGLALLPRLGPAPVLILTARDGVDSRVAGLDAGADDYLTKPFAPAELEARLRALLRRPGRRAAAAIACGDLALAAGTRTLTRGDQAVALTLREAGIFRVLAAGAGHIVVRDALTEADPLATNALEAIVSRLRRKLAALGSTARLESVRGVGYRLSP